MEFKGIDISKWNGDINWDKVKNSGIDFAMIREGYGVKNPNQIDKKFKENVSNAKKASINVGVYHYSYACSAEEAINEAHFCLENIQGISLTYPVVIDIEDKSQLKLTNQQRTDIVKTFCSEIEKAGYYAMFYCNLNWLNNYFYKNELLQKYDIWLAQWYVKSPSNSCGIWQYSSTGTIDGIEGHVDLNIAYKNYPEIIKNKNLNHHEKNNNHINKTEKTSYFEHTVQKGDTLWGLAKTYLGSGAKYGKIKSLNALKSSTIYAGQILKIPK